MYGLIIGLEALYVLSVFSCATHIQKCVREKSTWPMWVQDAWVVPFALAWPAFGLWFVIRPLK